MPKVLKPGKDSVNASNVRYKKEAARAFMGDMSRQDLHPQEQQTGSIANHA